MVQTATHLAQAPIEVAVRAALASRGRFDRDDVDRAMVHVMGNLSQDTLLAIAANPTGSAHLLQAVIPGATANVASNTREIRNWHGPVGDPSRFGTGRSWAGLGGAGLHRTGASRDSDGDDDGPVGRTSYGPLTTRWDASRPGDLHEHNWHSSPFAGIPGLDIPTARSLLAAGFRPHEIMAAGRDVERLGRHFGDHAPLITTPENIARATRLNREAPGFIAQVDRYAGALAGIRETEGGIGRDEARLVEMEGRGEGNSEAATALRAEIARRREEAARRRQEADAQMNGAIEALPETRRPDAQGLVEGVRAANDAAAREAERLRLEAAERTRAEERARLEAAEQARLAALLGEEPPAKGPATVVREEPATKGPAIQEGPPSKEAPPVRLTAAPGS